MNIANRLTLLRIILTFVFMFFLFCHGLCSVLRETAVSSLHGGGRERNSGS